MCQTARPPFPFQRNRCRFAGGLYRASAMNSPASQSSAATSVLAGIAFMVAGVSLFPIMNSLAKSLTADFPLWQVTWARFSGHLLVITLVFMPKRGLRLFFTNRPKMQLLRSAIFFGSNVCFIAALPHIDLATASAVIFTAPVIVTVLSVWFLGERVGAWRWGAVAIGFCGALVVIQPGSGDLNIGALLVLGAASCYAVYQLLTRQLASTDPPDTQIAYTAVVGTVVTCAIVPWVGHAPESFAQVASFMGLGCLGAVSHFLVIQALKRAPASVMSPIGYIELLGATALGYLIFDELPGAQVWVGAALIVGSGLLIAYRQAWHARRIRRQKADR
jgi:drug/metabolite transporter (DMT)-like permease